MYNCIFNPYGTVLDSAHIQHIIDQAEQMLTGYMDFFQIIQNKLLIINMCVASAVNPMTAFIGVRIS